MIKKRNTNLKELKDIHKGETGYLLGKGTSVGLLEEHKMQSPVVAINEAGLLPVADYVICRDLERQRYIVGNGCTAKKVFTYLGFTTVPAEYHYEEFLGFTPTTKASDLIWHMGTMLTSAFWLMKYMGFTRIHAHGLDGVGGTHYLFPQEVISSTKFLRARHQVIELAAQYNIKMTLNTYER